MDFPADPPPAQAAVIDALIKQRRLGPSDGAIARNVLGAERGAPTDNLTPGALMELNKALLTTRDPKARALLMAEAERLKAVAAQELFAGRRYMPPVQQGFQQPLHDRYTPAERPEMSVPWGGPGAHSLGRM